MISTVQYRSIPHHEQLGEMIEQNLEDYSRADEYHPKTNKQMAINMYGLIPMIDVTMFFFVRDI